MTGRRRHDSAAGSSALRIRKWQETEGIDPLTRYVPLTCLEVLPAVRPVHCMSLPCAQRSAAGVVLVAVVMLVKLVMLVK